MILSRDRALHQFTRVYKHLSRGDLQRSTTCRSFIDRPRTRRRLVGKTTPSGTRSTTTSATRTSTTTDLAEVGSATALGDAAEHVGAVVSTGASLVRRGRIASDLDAVLVAVLLEGRVDLALRPPRVIHQPLMMLGRELLVVLNHQVPAILERLTRPHPAILVRTARQQQSRS